MPVKKTKKSVKKKQVQKRAPTSVTVDDWKNLEAQEPEDVDMFDLDRNKLDIYWLEQPRLVHKYAHKLAIARTEADEAKAKTALVMADTQADVLANPEEYELTKTTVDVVKAAVQTQPRVRKAEEALRQANHMVNLYDALLKALWDRRSALENLVRLHGQDYFAAPVADGDATEVLSQATNRRRARRRENESEK